MPGVLQQDYTRDFLNDMQMKDVRLQERKYFHSKINYKRNNAAQVHKEKSTRRKLQIIATDT